MLHRLESSGALAEHDINVLCKESANGLYLHPTPDEMRMAMAGVARSVAMSHSNLAGLGAGCIAWETLCCVLGAARRENDPQAVAAEVELKEYEDHIERSGFFQIPLGQRVQQSAHGESAGSAAAAGTVKAKSKTRVKQKLGR